MEKRTRYNELLGIANHLRDPDLYQLLGWPDRLAFAPDELEERYRKNMSTLQGIKSPKHKSFIEFLKGELRRARATLADERQRQAYDAELLAERQEQLARILDVVLADNTLDALEEERLHALAAEVGLARAEAEALIDQELASRGAVRRAAEPAAAPPPSTPPPRPSSTGSGVGSGTGSSVGSGTGSSVGSGVGSSVGSSVDASAPSGSPMDWLAPPARSGSAAAWPGPVTSWAPPAWAQGALDPAPTPTPPPTTPPTGRPASANDIQRAVARSLEPGSGSRPGTGRPAPARPGDPKRDVRSTERRPAPAGKAPDEVVAEPVFDAEVVAEPVFDAEVVAEVVAEPVRPAPPRPSGKVTPVSTPRPPQPPRQQPPPAPADAPKKTGSSTARQAASAGWGKAAVVRAVGVCSSCLTEVDELSLNGGKAERVDDGRLHCPACRDRLVAGIICASCYQRITRTDLKGNRTRQVAGRIHHAHCAR